MCDCYQGAMLSSLRKIVVFGSAFIDLTTLFSAPIDYITTTEYKKFNMLSNLLTNFVIIDFCILNCIFVSPPSSLPRHVRS